MKLRSMELIGFKSFAHKTKIQFPDGLTEIVGPNGSGKSNVIEAIHWALGEQSVKKLRSTKMSDVIFSGSRGYPALNRAVVKLVFDNQDHFIKSDYDEISVARKLYRDGSSYYYLNGKECRLRDIQNLFMNSGVGMGSFSTISQGQVQRIFKSKPEDRRFIVETAAGIYRYKAQKHSAKQKLTDTDQNLTRLQDLVNELRKRFKSLMVQKDQAQKYLEYRHRLTYLVIDKTMIRRQDSIVKSRKVHGLIKQHQQRLMKLQAITQKMRQQRQRLQSDEQQRTRQASQLQQHLLTVIKRVDALNNQKKLDRQRLIFQQRSLRRNRQQQTAFITADRRLMTKQQHELPLIKKHQQRIQDLQKTLAQVNGSRLHHQIKKDRSQIDHLRNQYLQLMQQSIDVSNQIKDYHRDRHALNVRLQELSDRQKEVSDVFRKIHRQSQQLTDRLGQLKRQKRHLVQNSQHQNQIIQRQRIVLKRNDQRYTRQLGKIRSLRAQQAGLQRLMSNHTNLHRGERNLLDHVHEISGIIGPVAKFMQVPPQYIKAIETTLRSQLQHIIVRDHQVAGRAIRFLNRNRAGRVTLLPLHEITERWLNPRVRQVCQQQPGFIGVASQLVTMPASMQRICRHLLGNVLVAKDLPSAVSLGQVIHHRYRIVTLNGEVLNAGGAITGGRNRFDYHGLLSQRYKLKQLSEIIQRKQRDLDQQHTRISQIQQRGQKEVTWLEDVQKRLDMIQHQITVRGSEQQRLQDHANQQDQQRQTLQLTRTNVVRSQEDPHRLDDLKTSYQHLHQKIVQNNTRINRLKALIQKRTRQASRNDSQSRQQREQLLKRNDRLSTLRDHLHSLNRTLNHNRRLIKQYQTGIIKVQKTVKKLRDRQSFAKNTTIPQKTVIHIRQLQHRLNDYVQQIKKRVKTLDRRIDRNGDLVVQLKTRLGRLQLRYDQQRQIRQKLERGLRDHYQVNLDKIAPSSKTLSVVTRQMEKVKAKMKNIGNVNLRAIDEFTRTQKRYRFLSQQLVDLLNSRQQLLNAMNQMNSTIKKKFKVTFERINRMFKLTYQEIFKGGKAHLQLTDPHHLLTTGINIMAQPPGKRYRSMELLSGGEKALTVIALLFAVIRTRPVPFCILDEAESALDLVNVSRFAQYISKLKQQTQFIVITHRKETMLYADHLYGVTMQHSGISTVISVNLKQAKVKDDKNGIV